MVVAKPNTPVAIALVRIPRPATTLYGVQPMNNLAGIMILPRIFCFLRDVAGRVETDHSSRSKQATRFQNE